jgi:hypothetical protein
VVILLGVAGYYGWRQWQTLGSLKQQPGLSAADRQYHKSQARRRLISSALMVILAGLLIGSYLLGQERRANDLIKAERLGPAAATSDEQKRFVNQYSLFWIVFSLVLLGLVWLAFIDLWAIRRYAMRQYRQIQEDRRDMIEREVARLHGHERNGH